MVDIIYDPTPASPYPYPSRQRGMQRFIINIENIGGTVIGEWVNSRTPIKCICSKGHTCWPRPDFITSHKNRNVIDISICRKCSIIKRHNPNSDIAHLRFLKRIDELQVILIDNNWRGVSARYWIICNNGHDCFPTGKSINEGYGPCWQCTHYKRVERSKKEFYDAIKYFGGEVIGDYNGAHIAIECICVNGHTNNIYPMNIHMGNGICKICSMTNSNVFYVLTSSKNVKFGITSGTGKSRLYGHSRDGYKKVIIIEYNLPPMLAAEIEKECKIELSDKGWIPHTGHYEYFTIDALPIIINVVQRYINIGEITND